MTLFQAIVLGGLYWLSYCGFGVHSLNLLVLQPLPLSLLGGATAATPLYSISAAGNSTAAKASACRPPLCKNEIFSYKNVKSKTSVFDALTS